MGGEWGGDTIGGGGLGTQSAGPHMGGCGLGFRVFGFAVLPAPDICGTPKSFLGC